MDLPVVGQSESGKEESNFRLYIRCFEVLLFVVLVLFNKVRQKWLTTLTILDLNSKTRWSGTDTLKLVYRNGEGERRRSLQCT